MRKLVGAVLPACVCVALVFADSPSRLPRIRAFAETLTQLEQEYGDAIKAADTDRLDQILDDDWTKLTSTARILTKKELLDDLTSGKYTSPLISDRCT